MRKKHSLPALILVGLISALLSQQPSDKNINTESKNKNKIENYADARSVFWRELYIDGGETLYCGDRFGSGYHEALNIEHVYPMSWVTKALKCGDRKQCRKNSARFNQIEADLHNLYPSRKNVNTLRSSYAFNTIPGEKKLIEDCDFEIDEDQRHIEPRDNARGNIARAMFYMEDRYGLTIFQKQKTLLKKWAQQDPADEAEKKRNQLIEYLQGNKNSFIK